MDQHDRASRSYMLRHVFRRLFRKRETVAYPKGELRLSSAFRGRVVVQIASCIGCGRCARGCPAQALTVERQDGGGVAVTLQHDRCANCGLCELVCPQGAIALASAFVAGAGQRASLRDVWSKP